MAKKREDEPISGDKTMTEDINSVSILVRREIEALIAAPLIQAFAEEFGEEKTTEIAGKVIKGLAKESGEMMAALSGGNQLSDLSKGMALFSAGGALETENLQSTETKISFDVTRCKYAEMYKQYGLEKFGNLLSCGRDGALMEGFNPDIKFIRSKTLMEGDNCCDFCYTTEK